MNKLANIMAFVLFPVLGTATAPAFADGPYGAIDVGLANAPDACSGATAAGCENDNTLFRIAGGYQITPMWGAEISYGLSDKSDLGEVLPGIHGEWKINTLQVSGTGSFPLSDAFSLTGRLGLARSDLELSALGISLTSTTTKLAYGIGVRYDFTRSMAVRAQYEDLGKVGDENTTGTSKVRLLSAGLIFKF